MKKLLFTILGLVCITSCSTTQVDGNKNSKLTVNTFTVGSQKVSGQQSFTFISKPYRVTSLSFRVGGVVERFEPHVGTYYKKGEVIAAIDARDFKIASERAEALYKQAEAEFNRIDILYKKENISASTFEKAKADYVSAKTARQTALNELSDTQLKAPFDGYVGEVFIEKFQDVKPTEPVVSFVEIDRLRVEAYVPQNVAFNADSIMNATISFDLSPDKKYDVDIVEISKSTTRNNLSYLLTALLDNRGGELLAGMSGRISVETNGEEAVVVPQEAIRSRPSVGDYVWVVEAETKKATRRFVTLGTVVEGGLIAIVKGVTEGDIIATSGLDFIGEGDVLQISK